LVFYLWSTVLVDGDRIANGVRWVGGGRSSGYKFWALVWYLL